MVHENVGRFYVIIKLALFCFPCGLNYIFSLIVIYLYRICNVIIVYLTCILLPCVDYFLSDKIILRVIFCFSSGVLFRYVFAQCRRFVNIFS